ncbi:hypothetical protein RISK_001446 [Rhodopirellula islandica]|uniref:Uncharacterized protein n=1 Tax=Rhodopirellula islandica TaxID=595434 RepID=A0A0J1BI59_RHOIS|nr:hypothetical protein RISK_001446 [Rhodopirellula islandica]
MSYAIRVCKNVAIVPVESVVEFSGSQPVWNLMPRRRAGPVE